MCTFSADYCNALAPAGREQLIMTHILPCIKDLVADPNQHVKTALAGVVMGMAPLLGRDKYVGHFRDHSECLLNHQSVQRAWLRIFLSQFTVSLQWL